MNVTVEEQKLADMISLFLLFVFFYLLTQADCKQTREENGKGVRIPL